MDYITAKQAAEKWKISERRVQVLCNQCKIVEAVKLGWAWAISMEAEKPIDGRGLKNKNINH